MLDFVKKDSIVREIWGKSETIIFIFAGASAEFALNKAVDWLFFTGKLPADPLGRLFSTVSYAQQIVFSDNETAQRMIEKINSIHANVENKRKSTIPEWAYRDVLFMLIDYSIRAFELLERQLELFEKEEIFEVFTRMGKLMNISTLPDNYQQWHTSRIKHMREDLACSKFTAMLFKQYRIHLGFIRYALLLEAQKLVVPDHAAKLLKWNTIAYLKPAILIYKMLGNEKIRDFIKALVLPNKYMEEVKRLDIAGKQLRRCNGVTS